MNKKTGIIENVVRVKDIGRVVREYPEAESYITNNGKRCVLLSLEVKPTENVVFFGRDVDRVLKTFQEKLPESVGMYRIADQPQVVAHSINAFMKDWRAGARDKTPVGEHGRPRSGMVSIVTFERLPQHGHKRRFNDWIFRESKKRIFGASTICFLIVVRVTLFEVELNIP